MVRSICRWLFGDPIMPLHKECIVPIYFLCKCLTNTLKHFPGVVTLTQPVFSIMAFSRIDRTYLSIGRGQITPITSLTRVRTVMITAEEWKLRHIHGNGARHFVSNHSSPHNIIDSCARKMTFIESTWLIVFEQWVCFIRLIKRISRNIGELIDWHSGVTEDYDLAISKPIFKECLAPERRCL